MEAISQVNDPINVYVASKTRDYALSLSYNEAKKAADASNGKFIVLEVDDISDLLQQLKSATNNGAIKIKTLIIDSHGDYNRAKFQIGSTVVREGTGNNLKKMGTYLDSDEGTIVLLACHGGGNTINNGETLIQNLSCTTHSIVYGSRSWTGAVGLFGKNINPSLPNPDRFSDNESPLGWRFLGQWNVSTNGSSTGTLTQGITLSSIGNIQKNIISIQPGMSKQIKVISDGWRRLKKLF